MSDLPHGKDPDHLQVAISDAKPDTVIGDLMVRAVPVCPISQDPAGEPIVIVGPKSHPGRGLHLRRAAWPFMVGQLRAHASLIVGDQSVQTEHLDNGSWIVSWRVTRTYATELADQISAAAQELGA